MTCRSGVPTIQPVPRLFLHLARAFFVIMEANARSKWSHPTVKFRYFIDPLRTLVAP